MKLGSIDYIPKQLVEDKLVPLILSLIHISEYMALLSGNTDLLDKAKLEKRIASLEGERRQEEAQQQQAVPQQTPAAGADADAVVVPAFPGRSE